MPAAPGLGLGLALAAVIGGVAGGVGVGYYQNQRRVSEKRERQRRAREVAKEEKKKDMNAEQVYSSQTRTDIERQKGLSNKRLVVGEVVTNGVTIFQASYGPYFLEQFAIADHEIEGFIAISLEGNLLRVGSSGYVYSDPYYKPPGTAIHQKAGTGDLFRPEERFYLRVSTSRGLLPPFNIPFFPSLNSDADIILRDRAKLPRNFAQIDVATATFEYFRGQNVINPREDTNGDLQTKLNDEASKVWGGTRPGNSLFRVRGAKFFDPRDPKQKIDDSLTWKWTRNAALVIAGVMQHRLFSAGVTYNDFDIPALIDAANICDFPIFPEDGRPSIPQYTVDGVIQTSEGQAEVLDNMLNSCNGSLLRRSGKYIIDIDRPRESVGTLNHNSIDDFEVSTGTPSEDLYSIVKAQFRDISLVGKGQVTEAPVVEVSLPNVSTLNSLTLNLRNTTDEVRAQRIAKNRLERQKRRKTVSCRVTPENIVYTAKDVLDINHREFNILNGRYQLERLAISRTEPYINMTLSEFDNGIFDNSIPDKPYERELIVPKGPSISVSNVVVNEILDLFDFFIVELGEYIMPSFLWLQNPSDPRDVANFADRYAAIGILCASSR